MGKIKDPYGKLAETNEKYKQIWTNYFKEFLIENKEELQKEQENL